MVVSFEGSCAAGITISAKPSYSSAKQWHWVQTSLDAMGPEVHGVDGLRTVETRVAQATLVALAVFAPAETYATWQMLGGLRGLIHPAYIVTFTGMVLMLAGAVHSLRARPRRSPELLCVSHAWIVGYGLRSAFWRIDAVLAGEPLHFGIGELWATVAAVTFGLGMLAVSFVLTLRAPTRDDPTAARRTLETRVVAVSLALLAMFAPIETWATWQLGGAAALIEPRFAHKIAGMVLLIVGVRHSLGARPQRAPGAMCAAHAWWAAAGWGATTGRFHALSQGAQLRWGAAELWFVVVTSAIALVAFNVSLYLTWTARSRLRT